MPYYNPDTFWTPEKEITALIGGTILAGFLMFQDSSPKVEEPPKVDLSGYVFETEGLLCETTGFIRTSGRKQEALSVEVNDAGITYTYLAESPNGEIYYARTRPEGTFRNEDEESPIEPETRKHFMNTVERCRQGNASE